MPMGSSTDRRITCEEAVQALWEYLDGELTAERVLLVREHLDTCTGCHGLFTFEGAFIRTVADLISREVDVTNLRSRVVQTLRAQGYTTIDDDPL